MKNKWIVLMWLFSTPSYALDCKQAMTTPDINECAAIEQEKVEAELNSVYQQIIKALSVPDNEYEKFSEIKGSLIHAQRAWIKFREADCNAVYILHQSGTIRTAMHIGCMQARAEQRIKELKQFSDE